MYIFSGTPSRDRRIKRDSGLARPFLFLQKNICFAVQIPRKLDICMKTYIILSSKNDSSILDRQVRDCPDVSEKTVPQRIPRRYKEDIKRLQEKYDLHEGLVINNVVVGGTGVVYRPEEVVNSFSINNVRSFTVCVSLQSPSFGS